MKQKLFTLLTLALFFCSGAWADQTWDFTTMSASDKSGYDAATTSWTWNNNGYYGNAFTPSNGTWTDVISTTITQISGMKFMRSGSNMGTSNIRIYPNTSGNTDGYLKYNNSNVAIGIQAKKDDIIEITFSNTNSSAKGYVLTNAKRQSDNATTITVAQNTTTTETLVVLADGQVEFKCNDSKVILYKIVLTTPASVKSPSISPASKEFSAAFDATITKGSDNSYVVYTTDGTTPAASAGTATNGTKFTGSTETVAVATGANKTIKAIGYNASHEASSEVSVTYTYVTPTCATPTFSPKDGTTFSGASQQITLSCATDGAAIHYTLDGSTPTGSSATYDPASKPTITSTTTIKAIAVKDGYDNSSVATATITKVISSEWKSWNFTSWSSATQTGVLGDDTNWRNQENEGKGLDFTAENQLGRSSKTGLSKNTLKYGSTTISETNGLKFTAPNEDNKHVCLMFNLPSTTLGTYHGSKFIWLESASAYITIPSVPANAFIEIGVESHNSDNARGLTLKNGSTTLSRKAGSETSKIYQVCKWQNTSTQGDITVTPSAGLHVYYITVTEESVPVSTASGKNYATYVTTQALDFASVSSEIKAYVAANEASDGKITFTGKDAVPAGTPLLINTTTPGATVNVPVAASAAAIATNYLVAGTGSNVTYDASANHFYYILTNGEFKQANNSPIAVGKAYLALPSAATSNELTINFDDEGAGDVTGIATVSSKKQNNGEYFNLNGQRVDASHKGIVIVNGKKFYNK